MIEKLRDFYVFNDQLLYVSDNFIGFNPHVSEGFTFDKPELMGHNIKNIQFELNNALFKANLDYRINRGPLSGHMIAEIIKQEELIIKYGSYSKGYGHGGKIGKNYLIKNNQAFLLVDGYSFRNTETDEYYSDFKSDNNYLLWFENIVIPKAQNLNFDRKDIPEKEIYTEEEIEPFRQIEWEVILNLNGIELKKTKSKIPGFWYCFDTKIPNNHLFFVKDTSWSVLSKMEVEVNNI